MGKDNLLKAERYTTDLLKIPGVAFDVTVADPKERIQAYIDAYRKEGLARDVVGWQKTQLVTDAANGVRTDNRRF